MQKLDRITRTNTGFARFTELLDAKGGYWPTLNVAVPDRLILADAYDDAQQARGDCRRANRYEW